MVNPLAKMYTLGSGFILLTTGGLRYHGMSPVVSQLYHDGLMEARSIEQTAVFDAAEQFARIEGILPRAAHTPFVAMMKLLKYKRKPARKRPLYSV